MDDLFEKIARKEIPSTPIYEDPDIYAFLDIHPVNLGHTLVIPKTKYRNLLDTPEEVLGKMMVVAKKIADAQMKGLGAQGVNIEMNNEKAAGQLVFHTHIHVIPRYEDDGFRHWKGPERTPEEIANAGEQIRKAIS